MDNRTEGGFLQLVSNSLALNAARFRRPYGDLSANALTGGQGRESRGQSKAAQGSLSALFILMGSAIVCFGCVAIGYQCCVYRRWATRLRATGARHQDQHRPSLMKPLHSVSTQVLGRPEAAARPRLVQRGELGEELGVAGRCRRRRRSACAAAAARREPAAERFAAVRRAVRTGQLQPAQRDQPANGLQRAGPQSAAESRLAAATASPASTPAASATTAAAQPNAA